MMGVHGSDRVGTGRSVALPRAKAEVTGGAWRVAQVALAAIVLDIGRYRTSGAFSKLANQIGKATTMFKRKTSEATHVIRIENAGGGPLNPSFSYECVRCGATSREAGTGQLTRPCRK